jgi:hypothetical protein
MSLRIELALMTSRNGMNQQRGPTAYLVARHGGIVFATDRLNGRVLEPSELAANVARRGSPHAT